MHWRHHILSLCYIDFFHANQKHTDSSPTLCVKWNRTTTNTNRKNKFVVKSPFENISRWNIGAFPIYNWSIFVNSFCLLLAVNCVRWKFSLSRINRNRKYFVSWVLSKSQMKKKTVDLNAFKIYTFFLNYLTLKNMQT